MLLIEIIDWAWEHRGEVTLNAILLLILRKFVIREMHKLLHLGREGEVRWLIEKVEVLIGEKYDGQPAFLKTVRIRYIGNSYSYLRMVIPLVYQQRRAIKMNQNINFTTLAPGIIAVLKLVFQSFGMEIPDEHINSMVNGAAALMAVIAVIMSHRKPNGGTPNVPTQPTGDSGAAV